MHVAKWYNSMSWWCYRVRSLAPGFLRGVLERWPRQQMVRRIILHQLLGGLFMAKWWLVMVSSCLCLIDAQWWLQPDFFQDWSLSGMMRPPIWLAHSFLEWFKEETATTGHDFSWLQSAIPTVIVAYSSFWKFEQQSLITNESSID